MGVPAPPLHQGDDRLAADCARRVLADHHGVGRNAVYVGLFVTNAKDVPERIQQQKRQHGLDIFDTSTSTIWIRKPH